MAILLRRGGYQRELQYIHRTKSVNQKQAVFADPRETTFMCFFSSGPASQPGKA